MPIDLDDLFPPDDDLFPPDDAYVEPTLTNTPVNDGDPLSDTANVMNNSVVLELHLYRPSMHKKVETGNLINNGVIKRADGTEEIIDLKFFHISKKLIDSKDLKIINKLCSQFLRDVKFKCVKSNMLNSAMYLLPVGMVVEVDRDILRFKAELEECLDNLSLEYQAIQQRQAVRLGPEFNPADYPPFSEWRAAWMVESQLWHFNLPAAIQSIDRGIWERAKEKHDIFLHDTKQEVHDALRVSFHGLIDHFKDRLGKDEDGKPKTFQKGTVEKLQAFLNTFSARNITDDAELADLARQARLLMNGVDPTAIRKQESLREGLEQGFKEIAEKASDLIVTRERKFAAAPPVNIPKEEG